MMRRRTVLSSLGIGSVGLLSGCSRFTSTEVPVEVRVINNRRDARDVHLEIRDSDDRTVLTHEVTVAPVPEEPDVENPQWRTELYVTDAIIRGEEYRLTAEIVDLGGDNSNTESVSADCDPDEFDVAGSWWIRVSPSNAIYIYDNDIC